MSISKTYQQSLADAGSETRPPMLERWLNKVLDEGPYQFEMFIPNNSTVLKLQTAEDLQGDLMTCGKRGYKSYEGEHTNKVDRETRCTNEFDQFVAEPGEAVVLVYNHFAQLMNDLERNDMHFPIVIINTKFLNSLQPEWLKYVTQVRLAKRLTVDTFDDLFDYLQQFEKLVNVSRAKKLEKSHDPLALVVYLLEPLLKNFLLQQIIVFALHPIPETKQSFKEEIVEGSNAPNETENVQRTLRTSSSGNTSTVQCYNCSGKGHYARNCPKPRVRDSKYFMEQMLLAKQDEAGVILTMEE
ncbi:integrase, catalytic region, zinc finger, CCHC-type containing protein [Tanacetum coccineum]